MYKTSLSCIKKELNTGSKNYKYLKVVNDFINKKDLTNLTLGKHEIDENNFAVITKYKNQTDNIVEVHKKYLDVHVIIDGNEQIHFGKFNDLLPSKLYEAEEDAALFIGNLEHKINLQKGDVLLLFPQDAHKTKIGSNIEEVYKIIFKIRL